MTQLPARQNLYPKNERVPSAFCCTPGPNAVSAHSTCPRQGNLRSHTSLGSSEQQTLQSHNNSPALVSPREHLKCQSSCLENFRPLVDLPRKFCVSERERSTFGQSQCGIELERSTFANRNALAISKDRPLGLGYRLANAKGRPSGSASCG